MKKEMYIVERLKLFHSNRGGLCPFLSEMATSPLLIYPSNMICAYRESTIKIHWLDLIQNVTWIIPRMNKLKYILTVLKLNAITHIT